MADFELAGPFAYLKYNLSYFIQVDLFDAQVTENEVVWLFDALKNNFIDFTKVVF
jgi:hypothetical protein